MWDDQSVFSGADRTFCKSMEAQSDDICGDSGGFVWGGAKIPAASKGQRFLQDSMHIGRAYDPCLPLQDVSLFSAQTAAQYYKREFV